MHEPLLAHAALPAPTVVLGMLLVPYSLGHELRLIRDSNPLANHGRTAKPQDLVGAILICCHTWDEYRRMPSDPLIRLKLWLWRRRIRGFDPDAELAAFLEYRDSGTLELPVSDVVRPDRDTTPRLPGTPFLLRLHQWLMRHMAKTEAEAWDYPFGMATMRWACHWEQEGGLDIYNAHDQEFDRFVQEQEAKGAAQCPA